LWLAGYALLSLDNPESEHKRAPCFGRRGTMKINPQSATTLVWAAAAATPLGFMVMSPAGQFSSYLVAVLLALGPTLFGSRTSRVAGAVILAISLLLAFQVYPAFKKEGEGYRKRVEDRSGKLPAPVPGQ
jgi:membrane protein implicated in regulation of membrane protease activity